MYRVLKKDCLDLPEKIYTESYFELTREQRHAYDLLVSKARMLLADGTVATMQKIAAIAKLSQVASGFVIDTASGRAQLISGRNPKLELLEDRLEDDAHAIIWARYVEEIEQISKLMDRMGKLYVTYYGHIRGRSPLCRARLSGRLGAILPRQSESWRCGD